MIEDIRIDIFGLSGMWGRIADKDAEKVEETRLRSVYRIADKPFPPDFEVTRDQRDLRLTTNNHYIMV